eukprot:g5520.t1
MDVQSGRRRASGGIGSGGGGLIDPDTSWDLRRKQRREVVERVVERAELLTPGDRALVLAYFRDQQHASDIARVAAHAPARGVLVRARGLHAARDVAPPGFEPAQRPPASRRDPGDVRGRGGRGPMSARVICGSAPSERVRDAMALFGLTIERGDESTPAADASALGALCGLQAGGVALISGASGHGKSTLLRAVRGELLRRGERVVGVDPASLARSTRRVVDLVPGELGAAMACLSRAGLGEARLLARRACDLSEGERWRLALARAMGAPGRGRWVLADEFCSALDRETAMGVCASARRWARRDGGVRLVCAAAHEDLGRLLGADLCVVLGGTGDVRLERDAHRQGPGVRIERGEIGDYDALGQYHYRGGRPATCSRVLRAVGEVEGGGRLLGVLVESMPTLNAAWRDLPWPGRYTRGPKRERALRINRELRCVSRVVVDPRWRSMGVARRLVEEALRTAETPATEAKAAMGGLSPFFARAGMRAYAEPVLAPEARLRDALTHEGFRARDLIVGERADEAGARPLLRRELRRWAQASRATRGLVGRGWGEMARAAGARLSQRAVCYAHAG